MKGKTFLSILLAVVLLVAALPATLGSAWAAADATTLIVLVSWPITTLDPAVNYETAGGPFLGAVYDPLVKAVGTSKVEIVPWLAESWTKSDDGMVYTFKLRPGVKFHDGTALNAEAVKFSFERMFAMNAGAVANFNTVIDSIEVVDDLTVRFNLKFAFSSFLVSLTSLWGPTVVSPTTVKAHEVDGDWAAAWMAENEAGSGPYKLESYTRNQEFVLVRNPDYWRGWGDKYLERIVVRFVSESTTQRLMIEKGDADIAIGMSTEDLDALMNVAGVQVPEYNAQTIYEIRINTTREPLNNVKVRQALSYTFDYDQAVQGVRSGHAIRMTSVMAEGLGGYYKPSFLYTKDLDKARQLLAEAGYPEGGFTLQFVWIQGDETGRRLGEMWQADLKQVGIDLNIVEMPLATWWDAQASPDTAPDTMMGQWTQDYPDATMQLWAMYYSGNFPPAGSNYYFYKNEAVDKALEQARVEQDDAKRDALYQQAVEQIYSDAPEIWVFQPTERVAMRDNVKGYEYNFAYSYWYFDYSKMYKE